MKKCKNCGHYIRKRNGIYFHTITPTGRSNDVWDSHYLDIACRCQNPEPEDEK